MREIDLLGTMFAAWFHDTAVTTFYCVMGYTPAVTLGLALVLMLLAPLTPSLSTMRRLVRR